MCTTCGCGEADNIPSIMTPEEAKAINMDNHIHSHDEHHQHGHTHSHDEHHQHGHTHSHDEHHQHGHTHSHNEQQFGHNGRRIEIEQDILMKNNLIAQRNRGYFEAKNAIAINFVSSPGSGKTSLLEKTITDLKKQYAFFVIEGDQQTMNDAERIEKTGASVVQVNTRAGCHLDADMVNQAIKKMSISDNSFVMIENVGNLVCPASFDLGENKRIVIMSITEGEDKPVKYPDMFRSADVCIINKMDLLPYLDYDLDKAVEYAKKINPQLDFIKVSVKSGEGMNDWYKWLEKHMI